MCDDLRQTETEVLALNYKIILKLQFLSPLYLF